MSRRLPTTIAAGDLRHQISIVKPSGSQGSMGGISQNPSQWTSVLSTWASIEAWNGDASMAAGQFVSVGSHWIVTRNPRTVTLTSQMLVRFGSRTFQINAVLNPTETTKMLVLVCSEINDSQ
jgi:SPP1 family predicted phage head-tail adaptor